MLSRQHPGRQHLCRQYLCRQYLRRQYRRRQHLRRQYLCRQYLGMQFVQKGESEPETREERRLRAKWMERLSVPWRQAMQDRCNYERDCRFWQRQMMQHAMMMNHHHHHHHHHNEDAPCMTEDEQLSVEWQQVRSHLSDEQISTIIAQAATSVRMPSAIWLSCRMQRSPSM